MIPYVQKTRFIRPKMEYNICENIDQLGHLKKKKSRSKKILPEIKV